MIEDIENAVSSIGQDIFNSTNEVEYFNITIKSNGFVQIVEFIGIQLWNSEDDLREDINDNGDKEPLEQYLRRTLREELSKLAMIEI